jgi:hypothetical protein
MSASCRRTSRIERRRTRAVGRLSQTTVDTSSPSPSEKRNFCPRCGMASPRARKVRNESALLPRPQRGLRLKLQGHHRETLPRVSPCKAIASRTELLPSLYHHIENTQLRDPDAPGGNRRARSNGKFVCITLPQKGRGATYSLEKWPAHNSAARHVPAGSHQVIPLLTGHDLSMPNLGACPWGRGRLTSGDDEFDLRSKESVHPGSGSSSSPRESPVFARPWKRPVTSSGRRIHREDPLHTGTAWRHR